MIKSISTSNKAEISHILGLDYGKSKIGIAKADNETRMAFAYGVIPNDENFMKKLGEIVEKENAKTIIIGIPVYKHDSGEAQKFGKSIEEKFGIKVEYQNEMFTTKMAQENIKLRGGRNIAELDNQEAARIILQEWLDKN